MYDYKKDDEQLSEENKTGTFVAGGNISSNFKVKKEDLPQWAVDWARNRFNMDAKSVKFYVMDRQEVDDSVALASGNNVFVTSDQRNDEAVIKHELTHIYQQAIGTATESNAGDTSLEDEAVQVSKEGEISLAKNQTLGDRYIRPREKTNVVQSLGALAIAGLAVGGAAIVAGAIGGIYWLVKQVRYRKIARKLGVDFNTVKKVCTVFEWAYENADEMKDLCTTIHEKQVQEDQLRQDSKALQSIKKYGENITNKKWINLYNTMLGNGFKGFENEDEKNILSNHFGINIKVFSEEHKDGKTSEYEGIEELRKFQSYAKFHCTTKGFSDRTIETVKDDIESFFGKEYNLVNISEENKKEYLFLYGISGGFKNRTVETINSDIQILFGGNNSKLGDLSNENIGKYNLLYVTTDGFKREVGLIQRDIQDFFGEQCNWGDISDDNRTEYLLLYNKSGRFINRTVKTINSDIQILFGGNNSKLGDLSNENIVKYNSLYEETKGFTGREAKDIQTDIHSFFGDKCNWGDISDDNRTEYILLYDRSGRFINRTVATINSDIRMLFGGGEDRKLGDVSNIGIYNSLYEETKGFTGREAKDIQTDIHSFFGEQCNWGDISDDNRTEYLLLYNKSGRFINRTVKTINSDIWMLFGVKKLGDVSNIGRYNLLYSVTEGFTVRKAHEIQSDIQSFFGNDRKWGNIFQKDINKYILLYEGILKFRGREVGLIQSDINGFFGSGNYCNLSNVSPEDINKYLYLYGKTEKFTGRTVKDIKKDIADLFGGGNLRNISPEDIKKYILLYENKKILKFKGREVKTIKSDIQTLFGGNNYCNLRNLSNEDIEKYLYLCEQNAFIKRNVVTIKVDIQTLFGSNLAKVSKQNVELYWRAYEESKGFTARTVKQIKDDIEYFFGNGSNLGNISSTNKEMYKSLYGNTNGFTDREAQYIKSDIQILFGNGCNWGNISKQNAGIYWEIYIKTKQFHFRYNGPGEFKNMIESISGRNFGDIISYIKWSELLDKTGWFTSVHLDTFVNLRISLVNTLGIRSIANLINAIVDYLLSDKRHFGIIFCTYKFTTRLRDLVNFGYYNFIKINNFEGNLSYVFNKCFESIDVFPSFNGEGVVRMFIRYEEYAQVHPNSSRQERIQYAEGKIPLHPVIPDQPGGPGGPGSQPGQPGSRPGQPGH